MFALGCIQSLSCHTDRCPAGVSTQDETRSRALVVEDKTERVRNCHRSMLRALAEPTAAAGLEHPQDFHPEDFSLRVSEREMMTVGELYPTPVNGELLIGARSIRPFASSGTWRAAPVLRSRCNG
jgi:Conserved region in glutamate synthase